MYVAFIKYCTYALHLKGWAQQWSNPFKSWINLRASSVVNMLELHNKIDIFLKTIFFLYCSSVISCSQLWRTKYSNFTVLYLNYLKIGLDHCCARPFNWDIHIDNNCSCNDLHIKGTANLAPSESAPTSKQYSCVISWTINVIKLLHLFVLK